MVKPLQKKTLRYKSPASNQGVPKPVEVYKHFEPSKTHLLSKKPYKYKEADFPTVIPTEIDISSVDSRGLKKQEGRSVDNSFKDAILCERARSNRNQKLKSSTDTNLTVNNALRLMESRIKANMENLKKREPLIHPKPGKIKNDAIRRPLKLDAKLVEEGNAESTSECQVFIKDGEDMAKIGKTTSGLLYDVDEFIHLNSAHRLYRDYMYQNRGSEEEETAKNDLSASSSEAQRSSQPISSIISTRQSEIQKRISNENVRRENKESKEVDLGNGYSVIFEEPDTLPLQNQIDDNLAQSVSNTQLIYKKLTEEDEGSYCLLPHVKMNEEDLKARLRELRLELGGDKYHKVQDGTSATSSKTASINGEANQELQEDKKRLCTPPTSKKVKEAQGRTSALEKSLEPFQSKFKATSDKINKRQVCADTSSITPHAKNEVKQEPEGTGKKSCKSSTCQKVKETETDLPEKKVSRKTSSIRVSKSSTEIQSEPLQSSDSSKVIHGDFAHTPSTNTGLLLPDVIALRNELDTTKQTCHEEIRKSVNELRSEIAQYRQALNINVNILSGKLLPESMSGVSSLEETIRNQAEDDISKTKKIQGEQDLTNNTGKTQPIHNFSESDVHDGSSRIKRTGSNILEVDRPVKKSQSELMINPNTEFSEQLKFEDDLPKSNTEEIVCNSMKTDKSELLNYQETVAMSVLTTTKSATRQQLRKQSAKLEPKKNWSKPPNDQEVKSENKVEVETALPISVKDISFPCRDVEKCGDELTTNLRNVLDVLKLSLQLQSQIDENKRFRNMPNYDFQNIVQADFDEVICNLNGLIKSVGSENEGTEIESGGNFTPVVGNGINTQNSAESKPSPDNQQSEVNESVKTSHASCCQNMRNNINMLLQELQQSKEEHRNEMKKTTEIILQEFNHYKQTVADNMESPLRESQCAKSSNRRPKERDCSFVPIIQSTCPGRIQNPCLEKKVRLFPVSPDPPRRTGKCGCKGPLVEICACRKKDDKMSEKPQEKNEDEKRCHIFGCARSCINIQQEEKKPEVDKVPR